MRIPKSTGMECCCRYVPRKWAFLTVSSTVLATSSQLSHTSPRTEKEAGETSTQFRVTVRYPFRAPSWLVAPLRVAGLSRSKRGVWSTLTSSMLSRIGFTPMSRHILSYRESRHPLVQLDSTLELSLDPKTSVFYGLRLPV